MNTVYGEMGEVALPAAALAALGRALHTEVGALPAIHGLHAAGYRAGESAYDAFARSLGGPAGDARERRFWAHLSRFLSRSGWGTVEHDSPHPGVGILFSRDWVEAEPDSGPGPSCAFSAGLLAGLLTRAAHAPVAVLEVSCRSRGDDACSFAFGSEATIHDLYGLLLEGTGMAQALAEL